MSEVTISKVNRQFRTLRAKCTALNTLVLAPTRPTVTVTYGRQTIPRKPQEDDDTPPLAILQSLDRFGARLHLDRAIIENMQLSKRIYEVRDAFSNIVQCAFGDPAGDTEPLPRILSLTGICARIVGEHAQSEADAAVDEDSGSEGHEDQIRSQAIEELYENVPPQSRHFTFVAHALTYILDTCPRHPTLLNALLEVCLSNRLIPESHTMLLRLFTVAILPRPHSTSPCPLTHPAHKNFLTSLRETCTRSEPSYTVPPIHENAIINDRTFTRILIDALSQPCPEQMHAWTSKAVTRLARDLRDHDFGGCFVPLSAGLAHAVSSATQATKKLPSKGLKQGKTLDDVSCQLRTNAFERLAKWINSMLDTLHQRMPTSSSGPEFRACVDFLANVEPLGLHISSEPATSPTTCLADSLCCLAAYCLASVPTPAVPATDPDLSVLEAILRTANLKNTTFDGLVSYVFPLPSFAIFRAPLSHVGDDTPTPPPTLPSTTDGGAMAIDALASPLRARGLPECEVSLYLSALQHVEELIAAPVQTSSPSKRRSEKELFSLRLELMDRVEDAEQRCYGGRNGGGGGAPGAPDGEQEWVWEEFVGSWVIKSPAVSKAKAMEEKDLARASKRRKLDGGRVPETRPPDGRFSSSSTSTNLKRKAPSMSTGRTVSRAPSPPSHDKENNSSDQELGGSSDTEVGEPTPAPKRVRNFATILADSHRNVVSLRSEREAKAQAQARAQAKAKAKCAAPKPRASAPGRMPTFAMPESPASASISAPALAPWTPGRPRRRSNFATALADSHRNVISLREERAREAAAAQRKARAKTPPAKRKRSFYTPGRGSSTSSDEEDGGEGEGEGEQANVEPDSSPVRAAYVEPSSDDALNLFAYPDSSPVKARRRAL
ncbi:hypothetical protein LXA43DRAFT_1141319 [Ganoderma leucocontextum]|nr:hypothetical protein LXA43DRAFT_1141319 [Ganoderma leucocontextum]